jgi:hypothetical protein
MYRSTVSPRSELEEWSSHRARHSPRLEWVMWCVRHPASLHMKTAARLRRTAAVASWQQRRRGLRGVMRARCHWLSVVQLAHSVQAALTRSVVTYHLPSRWGTHDTSRQYLRVVGLVQRQPSDDACSTHCQIPAWISTSHLRVAAALRPIAGPAHSGRHRKPASVDGPSFVPARPIPVFRRVYGVPYP